MRRHARSDGGRIAELVRALDRGENEQPEPLEDRSGRRRPTTPSEFVAALAHILHLNPADALDQLHTNRSVRTTCARR